jgi:hypothetical protein
LQLPSLLREDDEGVAAAAASCAAALCVRFGAMSGARAGAHRALVKDPPELDFADMAKRVGQRRSHADVSASAGGAGLALKGTS